MNDNFKKFFKSYLIATCVSLTFGVAIFLICFFVTDQSLSAAVNGLTYATIILLCFGGLMFVANEGFFDMIAYGFKQVGSSMFGKKGNENNDFIGYKEQARTKREAKPKIYLSVLVAGCVFLIAMIVIRIVIAVY